MNKANKQAFENGDFKSVDSASNIERLKNLCDILLTKEEEKILESLRKRRNKIEHFKIKESIESVEVIMCESLSLILDFIAKYIDLGVLFEEEGALLEKIKEETVSLEEVVTARERIIEASARVEGIVEKLIICPDCLKRFLFTDGETRCLFCYYSDSPENVADEYISNVLGISSYYCGMNGDEYPKYECFECQSDSLVFDYEKGTCFCFNCGFSTDISNVKWCSDCEQPYSSEIEDEENDDDYRFSLCSMCLEIRIPRDD
jgi:hypothetical protein